MFQLILKPKLRFRMIVSIDLKVSLNIIPIRLIDSRLEYFIKYLLDNVQKYGKYLDEDYRRVVREDLNGYYRWVRSDLIESMTKM